MTSKVRVRFAPSPTGYLHIGGARTALFNWLFARHHKGTFILRIEDTDEVRSTHDSVDAILESMSWMGMDWDEGPVWEGPTKGETKERAWKQKGPYVPYFQMERLETYRKYLNQLVTQGNAYKCYCTPEELDAMRRQAMLEKRPPKYDGRCRVLTDAQKREIESAGKKHVLRFHMPEGTTIVKDLIRGDVHFENNLLQDLVIQKTSGVPTYNFACVVDDHLMEMSHVIRAEEHLSNTPSQILMYQALGWEPPQFAHLSMILGPDGSKLSKRHGATSVLEYRDQGYLPDALRNYLALLGWGTENSQDIFEKQEMIDKFEIDRCQKNPATFSPDKLIWMNGMYIRKLSTEALFDAAKPFLGPEAAATTHDGLSELVKLEQEKYKTLKDIPPLLDFFFTEDYPYYWEELQKLQAKSPNFAKEGVIKMFNVLSPKLSVLPEFSWQAVEGALRQTAAEMGRKNPEVFHPLRFAVSGRLQGPSLFHMVAVMGKDKTASRVRRFLNELESK